MNQNRPIISADLGGAKFVAVGDRIYRSDQWLTFHDFLADYLKIVLGSTWGNAELRRPMSERHPVLQWYVALCQLQKQYIKQLGQIHSGVCSGPAAAYLSLAYDLYLLRHHSLLEAHLVERIKNQRQFQGTRYELYVAATFIKAGFEIRLEDETDRSQTHCEFLATHTKTGKQYSVEAKSRHHAGILGQPGARKNEAQIRLRIGRLLRSALAKQAHGTRTVFIDVNMPPVASSPFTSNWFRPLAQEIERVENDTINGKPAPPAYIFVTNHPYHYVGDHEPDPAKSFVLTAINVPEFKEEVSGLRSIDTAIAELWDSVNHNVRIPHRFDE